MIKEPLKKDLLNVSCECTIEKYERGEDKNYTVVFEKGVTALFDEEEFYKYDLYLTGEKMKITLGELAEAVNQRRCYFYGVSLLNGSLKPSGHVAKLMKEAGFCEEHINSSLDKLREEEYLADERYAEKYVQKKADAGVVSSKMIKMELTSKGIPEEVANEAVQNADIDDFQNAREIAEKKKRNGDSDAKIMRYLAGKGFDSSVIIKAVNGRYSGDD